MLPPRRYSSILTPDHVEPPLKPDKGKEGGSCNRRACQAPGAFCKHRSGLGFYCRRCAIEINRLNYNDSMRLYNAPDLIMIPENIKELVRELDRKLFDHDDSE